MGLEGGRAVAVGRKKKADEELVLALACGASPEIAAQKTSLSPRTVYRRLKDRSFRERVDQARTDIARRATSMLNAAAMSAVKTLMTLQESARSESVQLGAARAVLELGCKLRDVVELAERVAALEARLHALLSGEGKPEFSETS
jgi:hypothetical protein